MKDLAKKDIEREPKSALYKGGYWKGHDVVVGHDGVLLPCQRKVYIGRDGELSPKVIEFFWGVHSPLKHTHDVG
ncbi:hypothetical protein CsSME_00035395 [Camellia sinensis var. sinensis]